MAVKPFSVASDLRQFLVNVTDDERRVEIEDDGQMSIHDYAQVEHRSIKDFVSQNPSRAMIIAEKHVSWWKKILQTASLTGFIEIEGADRVKVGREQQRLIEISIKQAQADTNLVYTLCTQAGLAGEERKQHLVRVLYNQATSGNLRAIEYLMNKVDEQESELDYNNAGMVYSIIHTLFDKQLEVLNSGSGSKIICCSRRSGKTHVAVAIALIEALRTTNTTCIIVGETMTQEEDLVTTAANEIIETCGLRDSKGKRLNWRKLENNSKILVRGLSNTQDPDTIRGYKAKVIIIDEFFHLKSDLLEYLQQEVLEPMQLDYAQDYMQIMIGTPPKIKMTYGEKIWKEAKIPHFHWYAKDNPYVKNFDEFVEEKAREKGIDIYHPWIRREYFGEWAYDTEALLYPDYHTYNENDVLPTLTVTHILVGLDYGVSDNDAIVAVAWDKEQRRGFVFYESKFNRLTIAKDTTQLEQLKKEARAVWLFSLDFFPNLMKSEANKKIYWQADSSDQHLTEELYVNVRVDNLHMNIGDAHKTDRFIMQDKIRDMLRTASILLPENGAVARECEMTILKRDPMGNLTGEVDDKIFHPDLLDSLRYAVWPVVGHEVVKNVPENEMIEATPDNEYAASEAAPTFEEVAPVSKRIGGYSVLTRPELGAPKE
jgi:hypothetical protein